MRHQKSTEVDPLDIPTQYKCPACERGMSQRDINEAQDLNTRLNGELAHTECYYDSISEGLENAK